MEDRIKYLIFRVYSEEERPDDDPEFRSIFYGWTYKKAVLKAFFMQRSKSKYKVVKMTEEEIAMYYDEDITSTDTMLEYITLKFAATKESIKFFGTSNEFRDTEKKIQRYFSDLSSVDRIDGEANYLEMIYNIDDYFHDALYYLGYRPPELEILFDTAPYHGMSTTMDFVEDQIDHAYDGSVCHPEETVQVPFRPLGLDTLEDVSNKILYSVESFVKILREDM